MLRPMSLRAKRAANLGGKLSCGKIAYLSKCRAAKGVKRTLRDGMAAVHPEGWELAAYRCTACGMWHIGHSGPRKPGRRPGMKEMS